MADTWVETFANGKWLNSTSDIVKLKCPNSAGVFSVFTFRIIIEVKITANPLPPKAAFVRRDSAHESENEAGTVGIAAAGYRQHSRCPRSERGLNR